MRSIFISYAGEDRPTVDAMLNWKNQATLDFKLIADRAQPDISSEAQVKAYLKSMLDKSNGIIILIGDNTHSKYWVEWEYQYARNNNLKFAIMRVPKSTGGTFRVLPSSLKAYNFKLNNLRNIFRDWKWKVNF